MDPASRARRLAADAATRLAYGVGIEGSDMIRNTFALRLMALALALAVAASVTAGELAHVDRDDPAVAAPGVTLDVALGERATADRADAIAADIAAIRASRADGEGKQRLAQSGEWASDRYDHEASRWEVELERDEKSGEIAGSIRISGSRSLAAATRVRGRIDGSAVSGTLETAAGEVAGSFSGTVTAHGMAGKYTTAAGDRGEWSHREWRPTAAEVSAGVE